MMKKFVTILLCAAFICIGGTIAYAEDLLANVDGKASGKANGKHESNLAELTDKQKKEVEKLRQNEINLVKEITDKLIALDVIAPSETNSKPDDLNETIDAKKKAYEEAREKWEKLPRSKKEEIYKLQEKIAKNRIKMVELFAKYGLIDKKQAAEIKENIENYKTQIRSKDSLPRFKGGYKKH